MGATSSRRTVTNTNTTSSSTLTIPTPPFSSCTTPSRSSSISPTLTPNGSRTPSIKIPQHSKGKKSSPLSNKLSYRLMKRLMNRDSPKYEHTPAWYGCEDTETHVSITHEEYPESSQYRQFQSTPRFEVSSPRIRGTEGADHSPLTLPQPVTVAPAASRTIHIQPNPRLATYFSRHANNDQSAWLSLEWILATRSATHGLFDAYPYHVFDAFLLRAHPTSRPCLSFLHAEQSFRDKWSGWTPCPGGHGWKLSIMVSDAKQVYQTYLTPIMPFLSSEVILRLEDIGLNNSSSIDPTQNMDVTLFIHGDMFLPAVHEVMNALRTGPFQSFIQTHQYQEIGGPTH